MRKKTQLIHGGVTIDPATNAVSVPIYQVSTYKQDGVGTHKGYEYSRTKNPTRTALETFIAELEGGSHGLAFASGMAAIHAVMNQFQTGDHIIFTDDVYGGTYRIVTNILNRAGIQATFVDTTEARKIEQAIQENTKAIYIETPTNPLLKVTDLKVVNEIAKAYKLQLIVDNTFATPYFQNPIDFGADVVIHSATKYIGGHSDVVAGLVVVGQEALAEKLHYIQNATGGILGPQDSWLLIRGLKTLGIRMEEHEQNANELAKFLANHPEVKTVYYPGLTTHVGHEIAKKQARGFGGMISFDVGSKEKADKVLANVRYFTLAESLGAVESLISVPAQMTHASIPKEVREALGITDGLIRISVGLEDKRDLKEDLENALEN